MTKGTTLIEVLVASLILGIVIGPLLYFMAVNRATISAAGCEANAANIIRDWFESVKKLENLNNVCLPSGNIGARIGAAKADTIKIENVKYLLHFDTASVTLDGSTADPGNPKLLELTAHVNWQYNNKDRHFAMSMLSNN